LFCSLNLPHSVVHTLLDKLGISINCKQNKLGLSISCKLCKLCKLYCKRLSVGHPEIIKFTLNQFYFLFGSIFHRL